LRKAARVRKPLPQILNHLPVAQGPVIRVWRCSCDRKPMERIEASFSAEAGFFHPDL